MPSGYTVDRVSKELEVAPSECMMVAAHVWDTIGAQAAGFSGALISRRGTAPLPAPGLPQPALVVIDLVELAQRV